MSAISSLTFLNFNYAQNCSLSGHALAALYNDAAVPLPEIIELVQVLSPDHFANVSADTIIDWYNGIKSLDEELWAVQSIIKSECHREFCKALSREHALGIDETGLLVSYAIQIALASFFLLGFAFSALHEKHYPVQLRPHSTRARSFSTALQAGLGCFWDTSVFFAIAISTVMLLLSMAYNNAQARAFTSFGTCITTSVLTLTWPLYAQFCHSQALRKGALITLSSITVALVGHNYVARRHWIAGFEKDCFSQISPFARETQVSSVVALLFIVYITFRIVIWVKEIFAKAQATNRDEKHSVFNTTYRSIAFWKNIFIVIAKAFYTFVFTLFFAFFSLSMFIKTKVELNAISGLKTGGNGWSIVQFVAILIWLPTLYEFLAVLKGRKSGQEGRYPVQSVLVHNDYSGTDDTELQGLTSRNLSMESMPLK